MPEKLGIKRETVQKLNDISSEDTIIASNSSSYTITEIIEGLELKKLERFVSMHSCMNGVPFRLRK